jgi:hypothetical protein
MVGGNFPLLVVAGCKVSDAAAAAELCRSVFVEFAGSNCRYCHSVPMHMSGAVPTQSCCMHMSGAVPTHQC